MADLSAFEGTQNLINFARDAIAEADQAARAFINDQNFPKIIEEDAKTGEKRWVLRQVNPAPPIIGRKYTEVINNLRNSFDQTLFGACAAIGRPVKDAHYPWADNGLASMTWKLCGNSPDKPTVHREFWDLIRSQEPYPTGDGYAGGNDLIRKIATFANRKHTVGVTFECFPTSGVRKIDIEVREGRVDLSSPKWDPVKKQIVLSVWSGDVPKLQIEHTLRFQVLLSLPQPLGRINASGAMRLFADKAQSVLDGFKARVLELCP